MHTTVLRKGPWRVSNCRGLRLGVGAELTSCINLITVVGSTGIRMGAEIIYTVVAHFLCVVGMGSVAEIILQSESLCVVCACRAELIDPVAAHLSVCGTGSFEYWC